MKFYSLLVVRVISLSVFLTFAITVDKTFMNVERITLELRLQKQTMPVCTLKVHTISPIKCFQIMAGFRVPCVYCRILCVLAMQLAEGIIKTRERILEIILGIAATIIYQHTGLSLAI